MSRSARDHRIPALIAAGVAALAATATASASASPGRDDVNFVAGTCGGPNEIIECPPPVKSWPAAATDSLVAPTCGGPAAGGAGSARRGGRSADVSATSVHESRAVSHWRPSSTDPTVAIVPGTMPTRPREGQHPQASDEEAWLARRAAGGDGAAFTTLYDRYERRAYNLC